MKLLFHKADNEIMSSYYINITNDGAGILTPVVRRGGTAATGGTAVSLPAGELFAGSSTAATSTKLIGLAIDAAFRALINNYVSYPTASYYINIVDGGESPQPNFTPTVYRGGTASSSGTVLTLPSGELFAGSSTAATTTKLTGLAVGALKRAILNDRAAGN
jgi:hypothetical protein